MTKPAPVVRRIGAVTAAKAKTAKKTVALVRGPLVFASRSLNNEATPCIAFAYLTSYLHAHGYDVVWVDAIGQGLNQTSELPRHPGYSIQGLTFEEVLERIPDDVGIVGFSGMFSGEWPVLRDLIKCVRGKLPNALLVAGGEHVTALPEYSLRDCPELDVCVRGEGEHTFLMVCESFSEDRGFDDISGTGFLDGDGQYVEGQGLPRIRDVDNLPWPYWPEGYLEAFWRAGKSYGVSTERDMPMLVSRGCPFRCTFCSSPNMWTTRYVLRDPDDVISEIKSYIDHYDITAIQLYDLTAITKKRWAIEFCNKLLDAGIHLKWSLPSGTRSEALDEETLGLLRQTGCNYLVYAPESGSPRTLKRIKKQISLDKLTHSALTAKRLGLTLRTNLIIGFPAETRLDVLQTVLFGLKLAVRGVDEVSINIFSPYPGTELFDGLLSEEAVQVNDSYFLKLTSLNSDYTSLNPLTVNSAMGPRELGLYRIGFMLANYALGYLIYPRRIVRTLRNLRSRHDSSTVLEHRLKDAIRRRTGRKTQKASGEDRHAA
jgi:radical SAM superfamily enzyme YgiQ (UPF0313 family)